MKIKDIAAALGLSVSTVSKAMSDATDVSDATKKRVADYLAQTDTEPRRRASAKRLCILLEDMGTDGEHIGFDVLSGFRRSAATYNYEVIVREVTHALPFRYGEEMRRGGFAGAFVLGTNTNSPLFLQLTETDFPTVLLDGFASNPHTATVGADSVNAVCALVDHLCGLGHTRIGMLTGEKASVVSRERLAGYVCGLLGRELSFDGSLVRFGDFTEACGETFADDFIHAGVTAVVCASDLVAVGLIRALNKRGVSVPNDVSVTGFDDITLSRYVTPALTTVRQDFEAIGKNAFIMLRQLIKGNAPDRMVLGSKLMLRQSTAPPRERA